MHLNHLNLCVEDLTEAQEFFQQFLGFRFLERKGDALAVMVNADHFTLVLSNPRKFGDAATIRYPEPFHVGFTLQTAEQVDQLYARLTAAPNVRLAQTPQMIRGAYTFYCIALSAIMFEITYRPEQHEIVA